jgi:hypothetical protein
MVKLFFVGVGIVILIVVGAFAAVLTPLLAGVNGNLGGSPQSPIHSPVPPSWVATVDGWLGQATPSEWLYVVLGLLALLLVYVVGALVARLVRWWKERRKRDAELRRRARVTAAREQGSASAASEADFETSWE